MDEFVKIYSNVSFDSVPDIQPFVIIGEIPDNSSSDEFITKIGKCAKIRSHTVIYAGNHIGANLHTGHGVLIRENNRIGDDVSIGSHSVIEHHVRIGDRVRIHSNVFIPEFSVLESDCWIGPGVIFTNARYPRSKDVKENLKGPYIHHSAKIGAGAVLLPGVVIGANALIGAGSVVTKDVPEGAIVVGNPAKAINQISRVEAYYFEE